MEHLSLLHKINLYIHIFSGTIALLAGIFILFACKGGRLHQSAGIIFLKLLCVVVFTGLTGTLVFNRNHFLLVITLLSGYMGFSGFRTVRRRTNEVSTLDVGIALMVLGSMIYFLFYFRKIGMMWSPVIIYSTVGYLILAIAYDFARYFIPKYKYGKLWLYEHIWKMVSAFSALLSAFTGTVLPAYKPYSQFLPSVLGTLIAIAFMVSAFLKGKEESRI